MSISQLSREATDPGAQGAGAPGPGPRSGHGAGSGPGPEAGVGPSSGAATGPGPLLPGLVAEVRRCLTAAREVPVATVRTGELAEVIAVLGAVESAAASLRLELSAEADARRVADDPDHGGAASGTDAWLAGLLGSTKASQAAGLRLAELLRSKYAATREAYAAGRLRADQVRVIVDAGEHAPVAASPEQLAVAEEGLVAKATGDSTRSGRPMNAKRLRQAARRMFDVVDRELADAHEVALLRRDGRHAKRETFLELHDNGDGTWSGRFRVPELHGTLLDRVLGQLTSPRRLSRDAAGGRVVDESAPPVMSYAELAGAAWCELIEHLPTTGHGPVAATMLITMDLERLLTGLGAAVTETGIGIDAGEARRLACNAGLVPAVLGTASEPLDLGRATRLFTGTQRRALALRHDSCAVAGCERPFAWCELHHLRPWHQLSLIHI